jgi:hypothetical protein
MKIKYYVGVNAPKQQNAAYYNSLLLLNHDRGKAQVLR